MVWVPVGMTVCSIFFTVFASDLPVLARPDGAFTPLLIGWFAFNVALLGTGAVFAMGRYLKMRDALPGWVAFTQVTLAFGLFGNAAGGNRYSAMAAVGALVLLSGFIFMVFGLLADHVRLLTREREKTLELQAKSAELTGILEGIPDSVFVTDRKGTIRFASKNALHMLQIDDIEEIQRPVTEWASVYQSSDSDGNFLEVEDVPLSRVARGEAFKSEEHQFVSPRDQTRHWLLVSGSPVLDEQGGRLGGLLVATDITARKEAENRVLELAGELDLYVRRLKTLLEEKTLLLKELQHRVKNNLQVVASLASLQANRIEDVTAKRAMAALQDRVRSMALIHRGLCFSEDVAEIDFASYVEELGRALIHSYASDPEAIRLHLDIDGKLRLDEATPCGLIVNELLSNALKHAFPKPGGGDIWVEFGQNNGACTMEVRDNGVGLPEGFEIEAEGSLGTQLVTDLVAQLGGTCRWKNDPRDGGGSMFELSFPHRPALEAMKTEG